MSLNTHLHFNGNCEEALRFYAATLGGEVQFMMTWGESPMADKAPAGMESRIMHASLESKHGTLTAADALGDYEAPRGFSVLLQCEDTAEADRVWAALAEGAQVKMNLQPTFWAARFGMLTDRYGIPWMINC